MLLLARPLLPPRLHISQYCQKVNQVLGQECSHDTVCLFEKTWGLECAIFITPSKFNFGTEASTSTIRWCASSYTENAFGAGHRECLCYRAHSFGAVSRLGEAYRATITTVSPRRYVNCIARTKLAVRLHTVAGHDLMKVVFVACRTRTNAAPEECHCLRYGNFAGKFHAVSAWALSASIQRSGLASKKVDKGKYYLEGVHRSLWCMVLQLITFASLNLSLYILVLETRSTRKPLVFIVLAGCSSVDWHCCNATNHNSTLWTQSCWYEKPVFSLSYFFAWHSVAYSDENVKWSRSSFLQYPQSEMGSSILIDHTPSWNLAAESNKCQWLQSGQSRSHCFCLHHGVSQVISGLQFFSTVRRHGYSPGPCCRIFFFWWYKEVNNRLTWTCVAFGHGPARLCRH